jgi:putative flippase GtrA
MSLQLTSSKANLLEALRYGLVGALNTLVGFLVFSLCLYALRLDSRLADALSYLVGLANSFFWNRKWTFKAEGKVPRQAALFLAVFAVSFLTQYLAFNYLKDGLRWRPIFAYTLGMAVYTGLGYFGNKCLVFRKASRPKKANAEGLDG